MAEKSSPVQSLDRAFDIMERLCAARDGLPIHTLTELTGLHKSTVHRMLAAMASRGYVRKDEDTGRYRMTTRLYALSGQVVENLDLVQVARAPMEHLRDEVGETVHLVVPEGSDIVYVHKVEAEAGAIRMFSRIGMRRPMYCTGVGKAILASMADEEVDEIWAQSDIHAYTEHTIVTRERLQDVLDAIRRRGCAFDNEENELGVRCIAAAIYDYSGKVCGALSISAPLIRMSDSYLAGLQPHLMEARDQISRAMGWMGEAGRPQFARKNRI